MTDYAPYSDALTDADTAAGFELLTVKNPHGEFAFTPATVQAVVFRVNSTDRIIKFNNPVAGKATYHHQRYGVWGGQDESRADWKPVSSIAYPTPEWAVRAVTEGNEAALQEMLKHDPQVTPVEPGDNY